MSKPKTGRFTTGTGFVLYQRCKTILNQLKTRQNWPIFELLPRIYRHFCSARTKTILIAPAYNHLSHAVHIAIAVPNQMAKSPNVLSDRVLQFGAILTPAHFRF